MVVIMQTSDDSITVIWDNITQQYVGLTGNYPNVKHVVLKSYTHAARWFSGKIQFGQLIEVYQGMNHIK